MEPVLQNRRKLLTGTAALFIAPSPFANPLQRPMTPRESTIDSLAPTAYVNYEHPAIQETTQRLSQRANNTREHALAIFQFVRDEIMFGFAQGFWDNKASDVLRQGVGYCNTKSTLFVALLRAAGIPARQVFVEIDATVLDGIVSTGTRMVDHSYVEVQLDNQWVATDAYIVDPPLFRVAQARLIQENRVLGYGVHQTGSNQWDGVKPSFSQYNRLDSRSIGDRVWGVFQDVGDFYANTPDAHNRLNIVLRSAFGLFSAEANRKAQALRKQAAR